MYRQLILACLLAIPVLSHAQAIQNILLTDDSFIGKEPGPDGLWNTADDKALPGQNTIGAASGFSNSDGTFGFWQGTLESEIVSGLDFQLLTLDWTGESSCTACLGSIAPISASLASGGPYGGSITSGNSYINSLRTDVTSFVGTELVESSTIGFPTDIGGGIFIFNGQDPNVVFLGNQDAIDHFSFLIPIVNSLGVDWVGIFTERQNLDFIGGPRDLVTGIQSYTVVQLAPVPLPASLPLLAGALLLLWRKVKNHHH